MYDNFIAGSETRRVANAVGPAEHSHTRRLCKFERTDSDNVTGRLGIDGTAEARRHQSRDNLTNCGRIFSHFSFPYNDTLRSNY